MKFRTPSYSLPLALLAVAIIAVVLISLRNSADAHGTAKFHHDLAMPSTLSHWDSGEMTYKFSGAFPRNWNGYTHQAAAHLERETFATGVNYNVKSTNQIAIEE